MSKYLLKSSDPIKALVFGRTATGKTAAIATLFATGQKVRLLSADPNAGAGIRAGLAIHKVKLEEGQLAIAKPESPERNIKNVLDTLEAQLKNSMEALMKVPDKNRKDCRGFFNIIKSTDTFIDTETKVDCGKCGDWGTDTTLVIDSLTTVCDEIKLHVCGSKPSSQADWNTMQFWIKYFVGDIVKSLKCNVILLGHPTKETDPVTGAISIYPLNLGQALNESFSSNFSDVLYSQFDGKDYFWSTIHKTAVCSGRNVPRAEKLDQDYAQFFIKEG